MKDMRVTFLEKIPRTPTVTSFRFRPQEGLAFEPGQFTRLIFDEAQRDNKELNKYLSFSSSPDRPYLEVTKRLSGSAFSRRLEALRPGEQVLMQAPMGSCTLKDTYRRIGFLIGGIGITPVISIIEYIAGRRLPVDTVLVYANRNEEEIAFRAELDGWKAALPNLSICYMVSDCAPKDPVCLQGVICKEVVERHVCDAQERTLFIFGPPKMVESMTTLAREINCRQENIKTEAFVGY